MSWVYKKRTNLIVTGVAVGLFSLFSFLVNPSWSQQDQSTMDQRSATGSPRNGIGEMDLLIVDYAASPESSVSSVEQIGDTAFRRYAEHIVLGLEDRFGSKYIRSAALADDRPDGIVIIRIPLVLDSEPPWIGEKFTDIPGPDACVVNTPWVDLQVTQGEDLAISGTFYWNERQILRDQTILAGATQSGTAPREPVDVERFQQLTGTYVSNYMSRSDEVRADDASMDLDLFWLFTRSTQSTVVPFAGLVHHQISKFAALLADDYAQLSLALLDECLVKSNRRVELNSISEANLATELRIQVVR